MPNVQFSINEKLAHHFDTKHLEVVNESHMHSVPKNSETHFKVVLVASEFATMRKVQRHQAVYALLKDELAGPVHALALHLYSLEEWVAVSQNAPDSPPCHSKSVD